jgi:hypothetical protein
VKRKTARNGRGVWILWTTVGRLRGAPVDNPDARKLVRGEVTIRPPE